MGINFRYLIVMMAAVALLSSRCIKKYQGCPKEGYEYVNSTLRSWYSPGTDSIALGESIILEASAPRSFIDENTYASVKNTSSIIHGPLGISMLYPVYQPAVDSFELIAQVGKAIKDSVNFSSGALEGFRTIEWDGSSVDSFKIRIEIRSLARGIYALALDEQGYKDADCARYKYFPKVGNADQHLDYWLSATGNLSDEVRYYTYCVKVY
jgi:hypothetical protein